jgi:ATP-dependent DNA helicase DinG
MARLSDLISGNSDGEKLLSALKNISRRKKDASNPMIPQSGMVQRKASFYNSGLIEFVAIDVETTGLNSKSDRIIEIGAIKFSEGKDSDQFSTFLNPGVPLPAAITRLTGITGDDLAKAPVFEDVAQKLLEFIGRFPVCGHQIDFDVNFINEELKRIGKPKLTSYEIDTALLSRIVVPSIDRYSLKHVSQALGIDLENAHRALYDAKASGQAACSLISKFDTIPLHVRLAMARFAPSSILKTLLMESTKRQYIHEDRSHSVGARNRPPNKLSESATLSPVSIEKLKEIFGGCGILSQIMKDFIERPSQTQIALCVAEAFNTKTFLVAEAGTGTGKSLAYLIPAALFAIKNNTRVLVATYTRNLQDQLIAKELPLVKKIAGETLRYCVLKGRSNYLCVRRYFLLLSGDLLDLSYRERMGILPLIRWAQETKTGDIEEQNQFNIKWFSRIWRMICADAHLCEGKFCAEFHQCFLQNARMGALGSHLVVINHSLFFSEICSESSFLGPLGSIIFDEAHHLEACGHRHLRVEVDTNRLMLFIDSLTSIDKAIKKNDQTNPLAPLKKDFKPVIKHLRAQIRDFIDNVNAWVSNQNSSSIEYQLSYDPKAFFEFKSFSELMNSFTEIQDILHQLQQTFESKDANDKKETLQPQIRQLGDRASQLKADLLYVVSAITEDHVFWIEGNREKAWIKLCGVALDISSILSKLWEENNHACVFTSATLSVSQSMDYFKQKAGLIGPNESKTRCESFKSPFAAEQSLRGALRSAPDPDSREYPAFIADFISTLMVTFKKNILVLFTSHAMLESVYSCCNKLPFSSQYTILGQGITGSRQTILDEFKTSRSSVLLGADSFWEGIDVPGKACEIVVITRLPFQIPTNPLVKAIAQRIESSTGDSFFSYSVPEAVIKFRQGTGRLIRTSEDRGALLVLDNRILSKNYGKCFRNSLDGEVRSFSSVAEMMDDLTTFFASDGASQPSSLTYTPFDEL